MLGVGLLCELRSISVHQSRQHRTEIMAFFNFANASQVMKRPDHPSCAEVKTRVAISNVVPGVSRPEALLIKMSKRIAHNLLDCIRNLAWVPRKRPKWHVTRLLKHGRIPVLLMGRRIF